MKRADVRLKSKSEFRQAFPIGLVLIVATAGCGGSSGSSGPPVIPAVTLRANSVGDSWVYAVATTLPAIGNGTGTYTEAWTADTYFEKPSIRITDTFNLKYPNGPLAISAYNEVSPTGGLLAVISQGVATPVKSDTFNFSGTFSNSTNVSGVLTLTDGTTVQENYRVVGTQRVTVPAGTFDCWVIKETEVRNDGTHDYFTLYMAPQTGNWVKADAQTLYSSGQEFDWHAQLSSTIMAKTSSFKGASPNPFPALDRRLTLR